MAERARGAALPWPAARQAASSAAPALPPAVLDLDACAGTVLAAPLVARAPLPPFDTAAMDGFAVAGPGPWRLVGQVLAGATWTEPLDAGTAVGIATGAPVPPSTDAVLPVEDATVTGGRVEGAVDSGRHVRRAGEECAAGDLLLPAGTPVGAAVLGLAAACGHDALEVHPRPRVAALVTGDELVGSGLPRDGLVRDALGPQLPVLVASLGGDLVARRHLPDDRDALCRALQDAGADVVVTTGASSTGPADHLRPVLEELGARVLVDGVACRPGHPQLLACLPGGRLVVGLPGNPLAALVAAVTVLGPALGALGGRPLAPLRTARLHEPVRASAGDTRLVPVRLTGMDAVRVGHSGAGMLRGAAVADALAVVPPGDGLPAGAEVEVLALP